MERSRFKSILALLTLFAVGFHLREVQAQDIKPFAGVSVFGGAERGTDNNAGGMGGIELFGLAPLSQNWGLQGSVGFTGRSDSQRITASLGPVYGYSRGKLGLFFDYEYKHEDMADVHPGLEFLQDKGGKNNYFFFLRGVWTHYFDSFDLLLSYSQPVSPIQNSTALNFDSTRNPPCLPKHDLVMNDLRAVLRFYPSTTTEINAGMLVNSFAGYTRNESGTGVGGILGASWQIAGPLILNLFQAQMDSRSRYRVTSGLQFAWTPSTPSSSKDTDKPLRESGLMSRLDASPVGGGSSSVG